RVGTDETAVFFKRAEVEREIGHGGGQDAAGGAARQIALEGVAVFHAAAIFVDQFLHGDAGGRELHARVLHAARDGEAAEALAVAAPVRREPLDALLDHVPDPEHGLDVLLERRAAEEAFLGDVRRTMARQAALAFDRLDHRRLFAADISARAAAHVDFRVPG